MLKLSNIVPSLLNGTGTPPPRPTWDKYPVPPSYVGLLRLPGDSS